LSRCAHQHRVVHEHLLDDRFATLWYGHAHMDTGQRGATHFGALDAFLPGVLALAGDTARAERLMLSVYRMWTTFGIEPEEMDYQQMSVVHGGYPLRPESIESAWYLYRLTGSPCVATLRHILASARGSHRRASRPSPTSVPAS
jgi:hypothetical protein